MGLRETEIKHTEERLRVPQSNKITDSVLAARVSILETLNLDLKGC